jgi:hypothetical protein
MQVSTSNQGLTSSDFDTDRINVIGDSFSSTMASQISKKSRTSHERSLEINYPLSSSAYCFLFEMAVMITL